MKLLPQRKPTTLPMVTIDHSFSVKGVGEVVLGFVKKASYGNTTAFSCYPQIKKLLYVRFKYKIKKLRKQMQGPGSALPSKELLLKK